jgi:predicted nuclease with TOPRIM domain
VIGGFTGEPTMADIISLMEESAAMIKRLAGRVDELEAEVSRLTAERDQLVTDNEQLRDRLEDASISRIPGGEELR